MRFDDTLETVLASDLSTPYGVQSAWRQLVDLIGRRRAVAGHRAMSVLRSIRDSVPLPVRAASARALEFADPPPPLVRLFALDELQVALPVLRSARMNSSEWIQLLPELAPASRAVLRNRRDLSPVVRRALESFGPIDFVLPDETVKEVPVELPEPEPEVAADPEPVLVEEAVSAIAIDWSEVVDGPPAEAASAEIDDEPLADAVEQVAEPEQASEDEAEDTALVYWSATAPQRLPAQEATLAALLARLPEATQAAESVPAAVEILDAELAEAPEPVAEQVPEPLVEPEPVVAGGEDEDFSFIALAGLAPSMSADAAQAVEAPSIPVRAVQSGTDESPLPVEAIAPLEGRAQGSAMEHSDVLVAEVRQMAAEAAGEDDGTFEIADVVARIDAFWRHREEAGPQELPALRPADEFRFETDAKGMIRWVDGVSRAPLVGVSLDSQSVPGGPESSRVDGVAGGAFRRRAGFSNARLSVEGDSDAAGDWLISAIPVFDPSNGRFTGYRGTARRPRVDERAEPLRPLAGPAMPADSLRQLVHELRTPTNAIAGFAEMIEAQMLGPVGDAYRDRAQVIRSQARELLGAIDDLDLAARIDSAALSLVPGQIALRPVLAMIVDDLAPLAELRGSVVALPIADLSVMGDRRAVERLLARLLATLVSASGQGERIGVHVAPEGKDMVAITIDRPQALADYPGDSVLDIDDEREDITLLGTGFALRLARNLSRELGGALVIGRESLTLRLPAAVNEQVGQAHLS
ncbi:histidine kinase dimerization/phospho-acceptor domain-containing protein [Sphingomonas sp. NIBR02145]|uniref:histidine kinase dimerization/phospho-acceptor domain-containing protein n=1 Tax=Sphingomonas sp. NIBR02145 TaxID=3014784 RepID=UPI0022B54CCC|nr:histidine kinase dimerization/phospho-acceptor domain-containing protein [Sphingomonas sp. NIBR02145]WHU03598.1 histidine kinase dimerization/phospho-acceptor domain-containing protein [Sphingomonas sp. NIBR02145]